MAIICDNCKEDITPEDSEELDDEEPSEHFVLALNGGKKCFCEDCFAVLSEFACSDEHRKKVKAYKKQFEEEED